MPAQPRASGAGHLTNRLPYQLSRSNFDAVVVWFEPWLFSGADQLVTRFFSEVSARLKGDGMKRRVRKLGT